MEQLKRFLDRLFPSDATTGQLGSIDSNIWLAHFCGIPVIGVKKESRRQRVLVLLFTVPTLLIVSGCYNFCELYNLALNFRDLDVLTQNICISFTHSACLYKILYVCYHAKAVRAITDRLRQLTKRYVITTPQFQAFERGEFEFKAELFAYSTFVTSTCVLAAVLLYCNSAMRAGEAFPYRVQLPAWLPIPIRLIYMGWSVFIFAIQVVSIDSLNITLMNQISLQLKILNLAFKQLSQEHDPKRKQQTMLQDPNAQLKLIIEHHCELSSLRQQVEDIFRWPLLVQFATSVIIFAMTGFQAIILSSGSSTAIILYFYTFSVLGELFLYCWFGNEFIEQSKTLVSTGFSSTWYHFDRNFRQSLLIFMINAQAPMSISAGRLIALSLPSFVGILSKSYSFIAVLGQIYGTE